MFDAGLWLIAEDDDIKSSPGSFLYLALYHKCLWPSTRNLTDSRASNHKGKRPDELERGLGQRKT